MLFNLFYDIFMNCFGPIIAPDANTLILGSFPSVVSLEKTEYYGHRYNAFWPIMAKLFDHSIANYEEKTELILNNRLALWDVCYSCKRDGSMDSTIKDTIPNEIPKLLDGSTITKVIFNGQTAAKLYKQTVGYYPSNITYITVISTSPAATKPFEEKLKTWENALFLS